MRPPQGGVCRRDLHSRDQIGSTFVGSVESLGGRHTDRLGSAQRSPGSIDVLSGAVTSSEKASAESDGVIDEIARRVQPFPNENAVTWTINSRSTDTVRAVGLEADGRPRG